MAIYGILTSISWNMGPLQLWWSTGTLSTINKCIIIYTSEGSKKVFRIKQKLKHWYQKNIFPTKIYFNGGLDIYVFDPKYFLDQATGGSKCSSSPLEGIKKKLFQTEIDFDVGSRLPLGVAIQNMNPFRVGSRFIDGCFRVYLELVWSFFGGSV